LRHEAAITALVGHVRSNIGRLNRARLPPNVADDVPALLRALQHYEEVADLAVAGTALEPVPAFWFAELRPLFSDRTRAALAAADTTNEAFDDARMSQAAADADAVYERLKTELLDAAADGEVTVNDMDDHMQDIARLHRIVERAVKAATRLGPHRPQLASDVRGADPAPDDDGRNAA